MLMQELSVKNCASYKALCEAILGTFEQNIVIISSDESHFHISVYVNNIFVTSHIHTRTSLWLQQNGTTAHIESAFFIFSTFFPGCLISWHGGNPWLVRLPTLLSVIISFGVTSKTNFSCGDHLRCWTLRCHPMNNFSNTTTDKPVGNEEF